MANRGYRPAPERSRTWGLVVLIVIAVVLPGFATMAVLDRLESANGLPGFWDYPSGVLGDGVLLPVLFASLVVHLRGLPRVRPGCELAVFLGSFGFGFVAGAAVPASWILGEGTEPFWMLPRPHHFTTAGWVHAGYAALSSGLLVALVILVLRRTRVARMRKADMAAVCSPSLALAVLAATGMLVLIGRDAVGGGMTAASLATGSVVFGAFLVLVASVHFAVGTFRIGAYARAAAVLSCFAAGLSLVAFAWPPQHVLVVLAGLASAVFGGLSVTANVSQRYARYRFLLVVTVALMIAGGLMRALQAYAGGEARPGLWVIVGVLTALLTVCLFVPRGQWPVLVRHGLFLFYCAFVCFLAGRMLVPQGSGTAGPSVVLADMAFDVFVFALIQFRFGVMDSSDREMIAREYWTRDEHDRARESEREPEPAGVVLGASPVSSTVRETVYLGVAVAIALLCLLIAAAGPLRLNEDTAVPHGIRLVGPAAAILMVLLTAALSLGASRGWGASGRRVHDLGSGGSATLELPRFYWILPVVASLVWGGVALALSGGPVHLPGLAAVLAVTSTVLYAKPFVDSPTVLQTLERTPGQVAVALGSAMAIGIATFWFVGFGMWQGDQALSGLWFAVTAFFFFVGTASLAILVGQTFSLGLPVDWVYDQDLSGGDRPPGEPGGPGDRRLDVRSGDPSDPRISGGVLLERRSPRSTATSEAHSTARDTRQIALRRRDVAGFAVQDAVGIGVSIFLCVFLPLYAATREAALDLAAINVLASMVFLPAFVVAVLWGMNNWTKAGELYAAAPRAGGHLRVPETMLRRVGNRWPAPITEEQWTRAAELDRRRVAALGFHFAFLKRGIAFIMLVGIVYFASVLLAH